MYDVNKQDQQKAHDAVLSVYVNWGLPAFGTVVKTLLRGTGEVVQRVKLLLAMPTAHIGVPGSRPTSASDPASCYCACI